MAMRTIALLPALVGAFDKPGGGITRTLGGAPSDLSRLTRSDLRPLGARTANMVELGNALTRLEDPPIKLLYVYLSNPAVVAPQSREVLAGLAREDLFVVVQEMFPTDTTSYADIVLPGASFLEFITPPHHFFLNSAFNEIDRLRERAGQTRVMIHPETARTRGIADGDPVRVFNNRGECSFLAQVTDDTQAGLLVAEGLHWPSLSPGGGANQLTSQRLTDTGETCAFHCNLVELQPQGN
jgi:anaerobic selenocysteine-containing dehydrogenase